MFCTSLLIIVKYLVYHLIVLGKWMLLDLLLHGFIVLSNPNYWQVLPN